MIVDKDDLILAYQLEQADLDYQIEESFENEVEEYKIKKEEKIILLNSLLDEVTTQLENKSPNILKIKEMLW